VPDAQVAVLALPYLAQPLEAQLLPSMIFSVVKDKERMHLPQQVPPMIWTVVKHKERMNVPQQVPPMIRTVVKHKERMHLPQQVPQMIWTVVKHSEEMHLLAAHYLSVEVRLLPTTWQLLSRSLQLDLEISG